MNEFGNAKGVYKRQIGYFLIIITIENIFASLTVHPIVQSMYFSGKNSRIVKQKLFLWKMEYQSIAYILYSIVSSNKLTTVTQSQLLNVKVLFLNNKNE